MYRSDLSPLVFLALWCAVCTHKKMYEFDKDREALPVLVPLLRLRTLWSLKQPFRLD